VKICEHASDIKDALYRQAFMPVRWVECVMAIKALGCTHLIECGPGQALSGMVKRIDAQLVSSNLKEPSDVVQLQSLLKV
jgi:[acyl-carrier-protein] S-malonyltransferase